MQNSENKTFTVEEVAVKLKAKFSREFSQSTIRTWIKTGKLPAVKVGGMILVTKKALDLFLKD